MPIGTIRAWNDARGFGFIRPDDAARADGDVFVHASEMHRAGVYAPVVGDVLVYAVAGSGSRRHAVDVEPMRPAR